MSDKTINPSDTLFRNGLARPFIRTRSPDNTSVQVHNKYTHMQYISQKYQILYNLPLLYNAPQLKVTSVMDWCDGLGPQIYTLTD